MRSSSSFIVFQINSDSRSYTRLTNLQKRTLDGTLVPLIEYHTSHKETVGNLSSIERVPIMMQLN